MAFVVAGQASAAADSRERCIRPPTGYGTGRILAFVLMICGGIPTGEIETYLHAWAWLTDAAGLLGRAPEAPTEELVTTMLRSC